MLCQSMLCNNPKIADNVFFTQEELYNKSNNISCEGIAKSKKDILSNSSQQFFIYYFNSTDRYEIKNYIIKNNFTFYADIFNDINITGVHIRTTELNLKH